MDFNSLKDQVSNLTLYDIKAGFRKAQNGTPRHTMRQLATANMWQPS
jgi:epsin